MKMSLRIQGLLLLAFWVVVNFAIADIHTTSVANSEKQRLSALSPYKRHVLIIYSFHDTLPWQAKLRDSLFAELNKLPPDQRPELFEERFEAHRLSPIVSNSVFLSLLQAKYGNVKLDLIISENDWAYEFIKIHKEFFPDVPKQSLTLVAGNEQDALLIREDCYAAVETALQVLPDSRRVVVISDKSPFKEPCADAIKARQPYLTQKNVALDIWDDFTFE